MTPPSAATVAAPDFPPEQLDAILAPVALYPDELLTQVLIASAAWRDQPVSSQRSPRFWRWRAAWTSLTKGASGVAGTRSAGQAARYAGPWRRAQPHVTDSLTEPDFVNRRLTGFGIGHLTADL